MNKTSVMKKSMLTGLTFAMVLGGSTAAFAQSAQNPATVQLMGFQQKAETSAEITESITRADMISLINRSFQLTEKAEITFSDLSSSDVAYDQIAIAVKAGYVKGYADGTIRPDQKITHKDAVDMVATLVKLKLDNIEGLDKYTRATMISAWSTPVIAAVLDTMILDITISWPKDKFTKTAAVTLLEKSLDFAKDLGVVIPEKPPTGDTGTTPSTGDHGPETGTVKMYDVAGVYGPDTGIETIKGNVVVSAPNITLQHLVIEGDLRITAAVSDGGAYFNNITVKGVVYIQGGVVNSVDFEACDLASVKMY